MSSISFHFAIQISLGFEYPLTTNGSKIRVIGQDPNIIVMHEFIFSFVTLSDGENWNSAWLSLS